MEKLTYSEELVMKSVWDLNKEPMLSEIVNHVNNHYCETEWKPQTVSTFLAKLVRKCYLKLKRNGKIYTYEVLITEREYKRMLYLHIIDFWYKGDKKWFLDELLSK
jgi:predicted transcriptional regulator